MKSDTSFRYEVGGLLTPIEDPLANMPDGQDEEKSFDRLGFLKMIELGDEHGLSLTIYASKGNDRRWFLTPYDSFSGCVIEVIGWPAYLDALARYSPIYSQPTPIV